MPPSPSRCPARGHRRGRGRRPPAAAPRAGRSRPAFRSSQAPADHELVPLRGVADVLELVLVLVGPEAVDVVVGGGRAEHRPAPPRAPSSRRCCSARREPGRRPDAAGSRRRRPRRRRARWCDTLVDEDPVVLRDRATREGRDLGLDPDADDGEVARDAIAAGGHDRLDPLGSLERGDLISGAAARPRSRGGSRRTAAPSSSPRTRSRGPPGKDRGHPNPELRQGGRHLATDEPHPDDYRVPIRGGLALDRVALGDRTQLVDPGQLGPGKVSRRLRPPVAIRSF